MTTPIHSLRLLALAGALATCGWPAGLLAATRPVDEHRPAEAAGQVEIQNVAGDVQVLGWDKPEVAVTGTLGDDVERLEVTSAGSRTAVRVIGHEAHGLDGGRHGSRGGEAHLVVHVPARSSITATLVSADVHVTGVAGNQELHTVSGDVTSSAQHEVRIHTVSGDVQLTAGPESRLVEIATVSGDGAITAGTLTRAHVKTVSGDFSVTADLAADGRLEAESVSGDFRITFAGAIPPAVFDLQSFSGDLSTCFGRKAAREGYGPGSRLSFQEGAGSARVRIDTKSGDVTLCGKK
jgi:hypothetical protein